MDKNFLVYLVRHGQTEWSISGQHTGRTDIPLTNEGVKLAAILKKPLGSVPFAAVYSSPLQRAVTTAAQAGFSHPILEPDLLEWDYGKFEGLRTVDICKEHPHWNLFKDGAPGGETTSDVGERADNLIAKISQHDGPVALFSHGHFLRVFVARWLQLPAVNGALFSLGTESISILGFEHNVSEPVVKLWNSQVHERS
jgi:broad specificity phosphatase PhoE